MALQCARLALGNIINEVHGQEFEEKGRKKEGRRKEEMRGGWEEVNGKAL